MPQNECLPLNEVLDKVQQVERDVVGFFKSARELTNIDEVQRTFDTLLAEKRQSEPTVARVCESLKCGERTLEGADQNDLDFLSALTESAFYRKTGDPADMADPHLKTNHLVDNALKLEKDLLLFYMKFYATSCTDHRPLFSELIQRGQRHVSELNNVRRRLIRGLNA